MTAGDIWIQNSTGRRVEIIEVRSQGGRDPPIVRYKFLDRGTWWNRTRPEFLDAFEPEPL